MLVSELIVDAAGLGSIEVRRGRAESLLGHLVEKDRLNDPKVSQRNWHFQDETSTFRRL